MGLVFCGVMVMVCFVCCLWGFVVVWLIGVFSCLAVYGGLGFVV